jgi:hypothetical protein
VTRQEFKEAFGTSVLKPNSCLLARNTLNGNILVFYVDNYHGVVAAHSDPGDTMTDVDVFEVLAYEYVEVIDYFVLEAV